MTPQIAAQVLRGTLDLDTVRLSTRERRMAEQAIKALVEAALGKQPQPSAEPPTDNG